MNIDIAATLSTVIKNRRTTKPPMMNGDKIPDDQIWQLLRLADWAPTHANTEPWYFIVYTEPKAFCYEHAELYKDNISAESFMQLNYEKILHNGDKASHLIIAIMKRGHLSKIPVVEEITATACAIQNMLLGATSMGIASFWSTGGMVHNTAMKKLLELGEEDIVMGILYLGYADNIPNGERLIPLSEKVTWVG